MDMAYIVFAVRFICGYGLHQLNILEYLKRLQPTKLRRDRIADHNTLRKL